MKHFFQTRGVCARSISFEIIDNKVYNVQFVGGCNGNLKAVSKLVDGMDCDTVVKILKGNDCGGRGTSCADQFAIAIEKAILEGND